MKYSTLSIASIILAFSLGNAHAADYETAHTFAAGDIISADMMNELFSRISAAEGAVEMSDILGTWECSSLVNREHTCRDMQSSQKIAGWTNNIDGLFKSLSSTTLIIVDDGDASYSYSTSSPSPLRCNISTANTGSIAIQNNLLFMSDPPIQLYPRLISETRFTASLPNLSGVYSPYTMSLECDKQATPPTNPTVFAATTTSLDNVLTWTDNSSDESGFKIYKKTSVAGAWTLIDAGAGLTVSINAVTYTDTVLAAGDNWYRVKASHVTNGDSIGSKVIKVTNSN